MHKKSQAAMEQLFAKKPGKMHFRWISQCSIHHNTKSQAAMEFLMTYGWALLIILLVIAALAYFGMLNPDRFLPDKVTVSDNRLQVISTSSNRIILKNAGADTLMNLQVNMTNHNCIQSQPATIAPGEVKSLILLCSDSVTPNGRLKGDIKINYSSVIYGEVMSKNIYANYAVRGDYFSSNGLGAYWPLDDYNDYSGNSKTLTCTNCPAARQGKVNNAYLFNGVNTVLTTSHIDIHNRAFSVSAWVNFNSLTGDQPILEEGTPVSNQNLVLLARSSKMLFAFYSNDLAGSTTLSTGQWYHVVFVYDNGPKKRTIYLNGVQDGTDISGSDFVGTTGNWNLGVYTSPGAYLNGAIDEVYFFNKALTADEVKAMYAAGR
jgi:hypothetical protein